jgi:uncharacterized protein YjiS (DUF1127 family)
MMEEGMQRRYYRVSSLDRRGDQRCRAIRSREALSASSARAFDRVVLLGLPLWMSQDVPLTRGHRRRTQASHIARLTAIERIVAAIRLWRERSRSRQQLRELDDHLLKDIGLRREDVC